MVDVFKNSELLKDGTLEEIQQRADLPSGPFAT